MNILLSQTDDSVKSDSVTSFGTDSVKELYWNNKTLFSFMSFI